METNKIFENIADNLNLGTVTAPVQRVSGGYMHKMYRLETSRGKFAVKLLNPVIMTRPDVFENYAAAESLEKKLQGNGIPVVPALSFGGKKMQRVNNQYYYVFEWVNAKALSSEEITREHCGIMGAVLARIHKIEQKNEDYNGDEININWDTYIKSAESECPKIVDILKANRDILYKSQTQGNAALKNIPKLAVISNGDMDCKNVLWIDRKPLIIDLECLNYGNPYMELFDLALCWSGYEHCKLDYKLLSSFVQSYIKAYGPFEINWDDLYYANFGRLAWLEYNIKRALMIECENEEEKQLGIGQVFETMEHVIYYDSLKAELPGRLNEIAQRV
ncbi:MAG: phosphotransferase [Clostridiales bacterium]|jgi:Ser/Thr protein kinase RdoA (MazF antagonist)|nr:phosphotransferase [Clostridiales bacterium]